jgi:hypothetical protein
MKRAPHSLKQQHTKAGILDIAGTDASMRIQRLAVGIYEIRYDFYAYPVEKSIEEAAGFFYDPAFSPQREDFPVQKKAEL